SIIHWILLTPPIFQLHRLIHSDISTSYRLIFRMTESFIHIVLYSKFNKAVISIEYSSQETTYLIIRIMADCPCDYSRQLSDILAVKLPLKSLKPYDSNPS